VFYIGTTFTLNQNGLNSMLRTQKGLVGQDMLRRAHNVQRAAKAGAPVGKVGGGKMRSSITAKLVWGPGPKPVGEVAVNVPYAMWVSKGTGVYIGQGYIRPRAAMHMVFSTAYGKYNIPSSKGFYYAEYVKGQKANPFLVKALPAALK
jgi:hypothetical protein